MTCSVSQGSELSLYAGLSVREVTSAQSASPRLARCGSPLWEFCLLSFDMALPYARCTMFVSPAYARHGGA